jgi:sulfite reductase (NADPH) hemoprotein beta-component
VPDAVERLIALYAAEREAGESAQAFYARIDLDRVRQAIADLEPLAADAPPEHFVDLAEQGAFAPEVLDGECSA